VRDERYYSNPDVNRICADATQGDVPRPFLGCGLTPKPATSADTSVDPSDDGRSWRVQQMPVDTERVNDWVAELDVDPRDLAGGRRAGDAARPAGEPRLAAGDARYRPGRREPCRRPRRPRNAQPTRPPPVSACSRSPHEGDGAAGGR
jgi:hypothetical protein